MKKARRKGLSPTEAFRAIYLDFEGFVGKQPALVGYLCEYTFKQWILDPDLSSAARAKGLPVLSFAEAVESLIDRCRAEDRRLVGFTRAESNMITEYAPCDDLPAHYRDAHKVAKRWINRLHRSSVEDRSLKQYLRFLGYSRPTHFGNRKATKRLRDVREGLRDKEGDYSRLTSTQKAKWTKLLDYNRVDCYGVRDLMMRASAELAVAERYGVFEKRASG